MGVQPITLPMPVKTTAGNIDLQNNYSGGNIAVYDARSQVLNQEESQAFLNTVHEKYRAGQASQNLPQVGWQYDANIPDATRAQVIRGADGKYYVSLQSAPNVPNTADAQTRQVTTQRQPVQTIIYKIGPDGEIYSQKRYLRADLDATENGTPPDPDNIKGYLTGYAEIDDAGKVNNRIQFRRPVDPVDPNASQLNVRDMIDENLIDTRQLPQDGSPVTIGKEDSPA
jgi:hypothetical protein